MKRRDNGREEEGGREGREKREIEKGEREEGRDDRGKRMRRKKGRGGGEGRYSGRDSDNGAMKIKIIKMFRERAR